MNAAAPAFKRVARRLRDRAYRIATRIERLVRPDTGPLPPLHLRVYYYRTWKPQAFARACDGARAELIDRGLRPTHRVLDIGSGIGNLAIGLLGYLHGGYDGVDVHREAVDWCRRAISPIQPSFRFHHADLASRAYNAEGRVPASTYRFPFADRSFDFIFLGSVFTHLLPEAVEEYVREISRLLAPRGQCIASYFLLNDRTRPAVDAGQSFISFGVTHSSGVCRLHSATVPEAAIAFEESFISRIHSDCGLRIQDVRRGRWAQGEPHDQDVLTAVVAN